MMFWFEFQKNCTPNRKAVLNYAKQQQIKNFYPSNKMCEFWKAITIKNRK